MRVGVDIRPMQNSNRYRGLGKFELALLTELAAQAPDDVQFVCYADNSELPKWVDSLARPAIIHRIRDNSTLEIPFLRLFARPYVPARPKPGDVDVFLQADAWGGIPGNVPAVAVFHDLIPLLFPDWRPVRLEDVGARAFFRDRVQHYAQATNYRRVLRSYRRAHSVVAISESSRQDYVDLIDKWPRNSVQVVLEAPIPRSSHGADSSIFEELGLVGARYLLYVGGIDPRKNIKQLIIDLRALLPEFPDLKLVVLGKDFSNEHQLMAFGWTPELNALKEAGLGDAVIIPGYVDDADLPAFYANAAAFVFPSRYEGFGLPVLEAMAEGCPVVCYSNSSLPEVGWDAAYYVEDGRPMAQAIRQLLIDPGLREELRRKGLERVGKFSWKRAAAQFWEILRQAATGATQAGA